MVLLMIAIASLIGMKTATVNSKPIPLHIELDAGVLAATNKKKTQNFHTSLDAQYDFGRNSLKIFGDYLKSSTESVESALHWTAGTRYEFEFIPASRVYLAYFSEADPFIGYVQRNSENFGYQYTIHKDSTLKWWAEIGYLHCGTMIVNGGVLFENMAQLITQASWQFSKFWFLNGNIEYLANTTHVDQDRINYEISLTSLINSTFSLRTAYLMRYMEAPYQGSRYQGTTTVSLVATF